KRDSPVFMVPIKNNRRLSVPVPINGNSTNPTNSINPTNSTNPTNPTNSINPIKESISKKIFTRIKKSPKYRPIISNIESIKPIVRKVLTKNKTSSNESFVTFNNNTDLHIDSATREISSVRSEEH